MYYVASFVDAVWDGFFDEIQLSKDDLTSGDIYYDFFHTKPKRNDD